MPPNLMNTPLSDEEYDILDELLAGAEHGERAMDVSTLEGLLTAVAIGPNMLLPSQWLPWVWDLANGAAPMDFAGMDDANRVTGLIMRHYNHMVQWLREDPASFEPIYECGAQWGAAEWCEGFLIGVRLDAAAWAPLMASHPEWFAALGALAADDNAEALAEMDESEVERLMAEVAPSVVKINAFLMDQRPKSPPAGKGNVAGQRPVVREVPKVGRNDPCHCGSGKKFKKCCGAAE